MLSLVCKDILIQKKNVLLSLVYVLVFIFALQHAGNAPLIAGVVGATYILSMTACSLEDKNKADIMLNSLPVGRNRIVLAKYASLLAYTAIGILTYMLGVLLAGISGLDIELHKITLEGLIGTLFAVCLLNCIYFPVYFKVGYANSRMLNFILFFAIFFGGSALIGFLKGNRSPLWLRNAADSLLRLNDMQAAFLFGIIMAVMIVISVALSLSFYRKREF